MPPRDNPLIHLASEGPSAQPKLYYTLPALPSLSTLTSRIGALFLMYPYNRTLVRRSWFLSRLAEAQAGGADADGNGNAREDATGVGKEPVHGDKLEYEEGMDVGGGRVVSALVTFGMGVFFGLFMASALVCLWLWSQSGLRVKGSMVYWRDIIAECDQTGRTILMNVRQDSADGQFRKVFNALMPSGHVSQE